MPVMPCRRADHRPCRGGARRVDRQPGSWCRSSRATAGQAGAAPVPRRAVVPIRRREAGARRAVPIIQGHGLVTAAVVPVVSVMPIIDAGKVVPCRRADRRREAGADHPGPRPGNGRGGARGFRHAHHRRRKGNARHAMPPCRSSTLPRSCPSCRSTAGKLVPIIQGHGRASWCRAGPPSCRRADSTAGSRCPSCRADHPGPRLATAAVVPVRNCGQCAAVPIDAGRCPGRSCRSTAGSWCRSSRATARNGRGGARRARPQLRTMRRRADHRPCRGGARRVDRQPGSWCRSSRATAGQRPRWCPWFPSCPSSTAERQCPSCHAAVPIIDLAAVVPVVPIDSREAGADHPGPRPGKLVPRRSPVVPSCRFDGGKPVPVVPCRSSRATARNGRGGARPVSGKVVPIDGGKLVPIIQGHGSQRPRWCPWFPSCRSSTAGKPVPIIQGHGSQRPRWCPSCPSAIADNAPPCRSTPAGVREGRADRRREAGADHPGPRLATAAVVPVVPVRNCGQCAAAPIIDLAAVVPVVSIDSREAGADHPGPRPGKLVPRRSPVVPSCRFDGGKPVPVVPCRSSRATARNGRGGARPQLRTMRRRADRRRPVSGKVVPIDGGKLVPIIQGHGSQRPRWCPSCPSAIADNAPPRRSSTLPRWCPSCRSTAGKLVPIIQGHGRASWCRAGPPSCRRADSTAGSRCPSCRADHPGPRLATAAVVPVRNCGQCAAVPIDAGRCPGRSCRSTAGSWCRSSRATARNGRGGARRARPQLRTMRRRADHRPCRGGARRVDRQPGSWCRSSRATAGQRPRWCPWFPSCPSSTAERQCPSCHADHRPCRGRARRADRQPGSWCRSSRATAWQAGAAPVPRRAVVPIRRREGGARRAVPIIQGHGLATAAVVPVVSVMPIIDGGKAMPVMPCRRADHRPCRGRARRVDRQPGSLVPIIQGHGSQRPRWCPFIVTSWASFRILATRQREPDISGQIVSWHESSPCLPNA